ncbi:MAG: hypothetical protein HY818_11245 [Acetobacterium woodii]|nr:hypothetical protein [Acetobacterium woodii]
MVSNRFGKENFNHRCSKKEMVMKMHVNRNRHIKKQAKHSDLGENGPGITVVRCPHARTCRFSGAQSKQVRTRCRGVLCRVNHWEACLIIGFKCQWLRKQILVEVKGNEIRYISRHSSEHQEVLPRLKQLSCQVCEHRVLDYHVIYGDAIIDVKCSRDGHLSSYSIK